MSVFYEIHHPLSVPLSMLYLWTSWTEYGFPFQLLSARSLVTETVADYAYEDSDQADPVMVKYVLYNLMQNVLFSIKALPEAKIVIQLIASLESQGMRCVEAENGRAALDLWSTRHCDLVLTDLQMP